MLYSPSWLFAIIVLLSPLEVSANALASVLQADCPTPVAFCNKALQYLGGVYLPGNYYTTYRTPSSTQTFYSPSSVTRTTVTSTGTTISKTYTVTATVGLETTTVQKCGATKSCGPVTFTANQGIIRTACTTIIRSVSQFPITYTNNIHYTTVYGTTQTISSSVNFTTTFFPIVTTTVPTKTAYKCMTLPPPTAGCKNTGVEFAQWSLTKEDRETPPLQWNLSHYKTIRPDFYFARNIVGSYYLSRSDKRKKKREADSTLECTPRYDNARGYIYAPQTGNYRFSIPAYNQAAFIWVGELAYSGYNVSNAFLKAVQPNHSTMGGPSADFYMEAGKYYAFRSAFRCIHVFHYSYWFNIRRPDGFVMFGEYQKDGVFYDESGPPPYSGSDVGVRRVFSDYIVRFGCGADAAKAPKYPSYADEP